MNYRQRLNAFKPTTTWEVVDTGLLWSDDKGGAGTIPWDKVKSVRLRMEPSRAETRRVALHVYTPRDHAITNIDYRGPLDFRAQTDEFREFVMAFHKAIPADSKAVFNKGSTRAAYIGNLVITLALFGFLFFLAPLLALTGIPSAGSILRIVIIIILIPVLLMIVMKNKPGIYTPNDLPMDMLK